MSLNMLDRLPPQFTIEPSLTCAFCFFPLHYREYAVTRALPVILTPGLWRWISHINEKGHRGGLPDFGSHGSAVSTACSNSPVSPNCWRTNREAEAAKAAYHYNKSSLGGEPGRRGSAAQSQLGSRRRSEGVAKKGSGQPTPSYAREFPSFTWGPLLLPWVYANRPPASDCLKFS